MNLLMFPSLSRERNILERTKLLLTAASEGLTEGVQKFLSYIEVSFFIYATRRIISRGLAFPRSRVIMTTGISLPPCNSLV